ncbi:MAG: SWIM zinc finger family protein [Candidatus Polarisedimenticolia bacterium]
MSLLSRITSQVPEKIRGRGHEYLQAGRVLISRGTEAVVEAVVQGTSLYEVRLERIGCTLLAGCSCPFIVSTQPCKHIWAAALAAQNEGFLRYDGGPIFTLMLDLPDGTRAVAEGAMEEETEEKQPRGVPHLRLVPPPETD